MSDKLTPCPFCAAPGYWDSIEDKSLWWCGCRECDVATKPFDTLAEAVAAWNRRATPTPPEPVKEADVSDAEIDKEAVAIFGTYAFEARNLFRNFAHAVLALRGDVSAIRDAALEAAAKAAEPTNFDRPDDWTEYARGKAHSAAAIRALRGRTA